MNNYNYYQPPIQQRTQTAAVLKGRPVSSLEEVRAIPVDFDGSIFYFPSLANDRIYTKQINLDGTSTVKMYELKELPIEGSISVPDNLVTKEEFDRTVKDLMDQIARLSAAPSPEISKPVPAEFNF